MINPEGTTIPQPDGSDRNIIIEPVLSKNIDGTWGTTGQFKIFKNSLGEETHLFSEPLILMTGNHDT